MKIYLASTAPGNEGCEEIPHMILPFRLLSYYHIIKKVLSVDKVFYSIIKDKEHKDENKKDRTSRRVVRC